MPEWSELEQDICYWLAGFQSANVIFRNSHQSIPGFPTDGPKSDGLLADENIIIAIEVEAGQTHPDTNTGKYWLLQSNYKQYERIILFHIYTPKFNSYGWRKELGEFFAAQMEEANVPIEYLLLDYRNSLDYGQTLSELKAIIERRIREILPMASFG